jgi:hypothetical protein
MKSEKNESEIMMARKENMTTNALIIIPFFSCFMRKSAISINGILIIADTRTANQSGMPSDEKSPVITMASDINIRHIAIFSYVLRDG